MSSLPAASPDGSKTEYTDPSTIAPSTATSAQTVQLSFIEVLSKEIDRIDEERRTACTLLYSLEKLQESRSSPLTKLTGVFKKETPLEKDIQDLKSDLERLQSQRTKFQNERGRMEMDQRLQKPLEKMNSPTRVADTAVRSRRRRI